MLYIVATPIGNLEDITYRAARILSEADIIASEDTRRTGKLLKHLGIKSRMVSYNDHNRDRRIPYLVEEMRLGKTVALVTDAGTPCISDPGLRLVRATVQAGIQVSPIPGPSSVIAALSCSGFPDKFCFRGFLPKKKGKRLEELRSITGTTVFLESPHRIEKTVAELAEVLPDTEICIGRELTKKFEEFVRGKPLEVLGKIRGKKGEMVLVVQG